MGGFLSDQVFIDKRGNRIWPSAIVSPDARMGCENQIFPGAYLGPGARIGDHNVLQPYSIVGSASQARAKDAAGSLHVGNNNEFHPFCVANIASFADGVTSIGNDVILMQGAYVGHDCIIEDRAVISNYSALAGHVTIRQDASIGAFALVAQRLTIGRFAHVLPQAAVRRNVWAFESFDGASDRPSKINTRGVRRIKGTIKDVIAIRDWYAGNLERVPDATLHECVHAEIHRKT